ncbi:MAG: DUF5801 repeats-in-toxin domain-containing protein, partial [Synechococcaceae cyanobacterium ELA445]
SSATLNIGSNLVFKDDGPAISLANITEQVLTVDETSLATNASTSFAAAFSSSFGADGAGNITYSLATAGGSSALTDVATGLAVNLYLIGGQVVGSTATTQAGVNAGNTDFTVSVDAAGVVTLDQIKALAHPNTNNPDDSVSLADSLIGLKATITDKDGDASSATLNIGSNLVFKDDGPTALADIDSVKEDSQLVATGNVITGTDVSVSPDSNSTDGVADTRGADGAFISSASSNNVPANSDNTPDVSNNFQVAGQYGSLVLNTNGSYSYTLNNSLDAVQTLNTGQSLTDTFSYTLKDGDGDTSTTTLTITINGTTDDKGIVVGQNISDTSSTQGTAATTDDHAVDNTPSKPDGPIDGTPSADVLIGDIGGTTTTVVPGAKYNIVIIADTSGSMAWDAATGSSTNITLSRINLLKSSLTNLVNQLDDHSSTGGKVNISLVNFASDVNSVDLNGSATGTPSSVIDLTTQNSAGVLSAINSLSATGGTNYDAAFAKAASEVAALQTSYSSAQGYQTITYFLTDGDPTYYINNSTGALGGNGSSTTARELNEAIATFASLSTKSTVYAIGIGNSTNTNYLQFFDNTSNPVTKAITVGGASVTGPAATPDIVTSGDQLDSILQGGSTTTTISPVGDDVINGGSGDDVILGDSIFSTSIDKGWADFVSANPTLTTDQAKAENIYANLTSNNPTYAREGSVGGNDTIDGGAGNDAIFGQGGNDNIFGGSGNDRIDGGSGNDVIRGGTGVDTLTGGTGNDQFVFFKGEGSNDAATAEIDVITDFTINTDTIVINGNGTNISSVVVGTPSSNVYTITVTYTDSSIEYFKVNLTNSAVLNDAPGGVTSSVVIAGTSATIDGTIVGATLYLDINHNNQEDAGERLGITDAKGHVEWVVDLSTLDVNGDGQFTLGEARAVQSGGLDIDTGLTYEINLYGQVGASVVTPFTSLLQTLLENGVDYASANATLVSHLGLDAGTDLASLNPIQGSSAILGQNAAVMTAAVQFSELVAHQLGTDEAHASFSVFAAISHSLTTLPDGQVADFSNPALLSSVAAQLQLSNFGASDISEFMVASQQALQHSLDTLAPGGDALAAISAVQHLVQGSYAQALGSVEAGDLSTHALDDLTHTLTAYSQGDLSIDQLSNFDHQLTVAGADHQITNTEFTQALTTLPGHTDIAHTALPQTDVHGLVDQFLVGLHTNDTTGAAPTHNDVIYELDLAVSAFIQDHGITADQYHDIHQQVIDHLAQDLQQHGLVDPTAIHHDTGGHADGSDVIAAVDTHFSDLYHNHFDTNDVHVYDASHHV